MTALASCARSKLGPMDMPTFSKISAAYRNTVPVILPSGTSVHLRCRAGPLTFHTVSAMAEHLERVIPFKVIPVLLTEEPAAEEVCFNRRKSHGTVAKG
jgi:hypothetical protein